VKKFIFIINGGPIKNIGTSGGEERCLLLADYIYSKNNDVCICCPEEYLNAKRLKVTSFLTYPSLPFEEKMHGNLPALFLIYCYRIVLSTVKIHKINADIIISSSHLFHDVVPLLFLGNGKRIFVTYLHHIILEQGRRGFSSSVTGFLEKLSFYILKKVGSIVFTDSAANKALLINKYGFEKNLVYVINNGINLKFINSIKVSKKPDYDICFCGRLHKSKGVYDLVKIVKMVKEHHPNISCVIIGQGPEKVNLIREINSNNLESHIKLVGFLTEKEKIETMKLSKIFVLPSHEEGWGIVIGEALACGLPTVVYKLKAISGIWGNTVTWVECFDTNKFSATITRLLEDEVEKQFFTQKGIEFAKTINWPDILKKELSIIMDNGRSVYVKQLS
jgi:glycosyltransferase involved in cell wall biosynthesis